MDISQFILRKLTLDDLDQYNDLYRYAFQVTEATLLESGWENEEIKRSKYPVLERADVWGFFDGNTLISQIAAYPLAINIHSVIYPIAFITSVSTYPEYSGIGLMSKLMIKSLTEMRESKQSLALLYPYSIPLYRKKGWEIVADKMSYNLKDTQLPKHTNTPGYVRRVPKENVEFMNLHTQFAMRTHGCLFRNNLAWDEYWRWDEEDTTVAIYYKQDDEPGGYMVYLIKDNILYVKEMIYLDFESKKGLWNFISAHESMINEVKGFNYFSEPIAFDLEDSAIKESIRPYIMGRIVDVEQFFEKYPFRPNLSESFTFNISDPILEWNNKSFTFEISHGKAKIINTPSKHQLTLSIGTLTTMMIGYKRVSDLVELERIKTDPDTIQLLEQLIQYKKPYISDYI
ncbi:MAG TPA: GNAT family N-acetyltransferase [Methanocorpusculum sp.]|nr:GNAT family N-acetyltransferase [Methanocorpusculum sp.]